MKSTKCFSPLLTAEVKLVGKEGDKDVVHTHSVRYNDTYVKVDDKWLIAKRIANFMISEIA